MRCFGQHLRRGRRGPHPNRSSPAGERWRRGGARGGAGGRDKGGRQLGIGGLLQQRIAARRRIPCSCSLRCETSGQGERERAPRAALPTTRRGRGSADGTPPVLALRSLPGLGPSAHPRGRRGLDSQGVCGRTRQGGRGEPRAPLPVACGCLAPVGLPPARPARRSASGRMKPVPCVPSPLPKPWEKLAACNSSSSAWCSHFLGTWRLSYLGSGRNFPPLSDGFGLGVCLPLPGIC